MFLFKESYVWKMYQERCWEFFPAGDCFRKQYEDQLNWPVHGATDSFTLEPPHGPLLVPHNVLTAVWGATGLSNHSFYSPLRSSSTQIHMSIFSSRPSSQPSSTTQSACKLSCNLQHTLFGCSENFVHRKYQIINCIICNWWHVDDDLFS